MKRFIALLLSAIFIFSVTSCSKKGSDTDVSDKPTVITTMFPEYDAARAVGGDKIVLTQLMSPGSESHYYEASLSDISKIQKSDLFVYNGGESEKWVIDVLASIDKNKVSVIRYMDVAELIYETADGIIQIEEHEHEHDEDGEDHDAQHEHDEGEEEHEYDEHVWTNPQNQIKLVREVSNKLCAIDEENSDYYKTNAESYITRLQALDDEFTEIRANAKSDLIVFAERFPFKYFTHKYSLEHLAAFSGCSSDSEPTLSTITTLTNAVIENKVKVVFFIEFSTEKVADSICASTGAKKLLLHSCHNVSANDFKNGVTYVDLMKKNAENLREALS